MGEEICARVCRCAAVAWGIKPDRVNQDSVMEAIPQWDSLGHLKLTMALEKEFKMTFHPRDTVRMRSIKKICEIIGEVGK